MLLFVELAVREEGLLDVRTVGETWADCCWSRMEIEREI